MHRKFLQKVLPLAIVALLLSGCSGSVVIPEFDSVNQALQFILDLAGPQVITLFLLILANTLFGVAVAVKIGTFDFSELGRFLQTEVIPKLIGWSALKLLFTYGTEGLGDLGQNLTIGLVDAVWGALVLALVGDILSKLSVLGLEAIGKLPGINAPVG